MKRHIFGVSAVALIAIVLLGVEIPACRDLGRRSALYRKDKAAVIELERAYRRPVFGQPIDQNAAVWYGRALPHLSAVKLPDLTPAMNAGAAQYDVATEALLDGPCAEAGSERVQTALRCSYCDWQIRFDTESINSPHTREALALGKCLTIAGHRSAHRYEPREAAKHYLDGVTVGCDLGNGSESMLIVSEIVIADNLLALGRLASTANDDVFLRHAAADLAEFENKLPDGKTPMMRQRLWAQNIASLRQLETAGGAGLKLLRLNQVLGVRSLAAEDAVFDDAERLAHLTSRSEGLQLSQRLKADVAASHNEIVRTMNLPQSALIAAGAVELAGIYRAAQAAIELQQWRLEHGTYPETAAAMGLELQPYELRYERSIDGQGYKLIGPRATLIER